MFLFHRIFHLFKIPKTIHNTLSSLVLAQPLLHMKNNTLNHDQRSFMTTQTSVTGPHILFVFRKFNSRCSTCVIHSEICAPFIYKNLVMSCMMSRMTAAHDSTCHFSVVTEVAPNYSDTWLPFLLVTS